MAKKKVTRKELLKETDEFLSVSARAAIFVREHSRQFKYLGATIVAVIIIYLGINAYFNRIDKKGQQAYNTAYYALLENINGPGGDQKDLKKAEALFQEVLDNYGLSKVRPLAFPELAYLNFTQKKYDEAISHYEQYLREVTDGSPYQAMTRLALAACHEEKGAFNKAIELLEQITSVSDDFFKEQAMISLARVYRLANQPQKSKETLETFFEKFKESPFLPLVRSHLDRYKP